MPDREDGMARLVGYRAAADGKLRVNNLKRPNCMLTGVQRLIFAAATLFLASFLASAAGSSAYAQSGPFAGMPGTWAGGGTVTLDDGSSERIRCRGTYAVGSGGNGLNQSLTCPSDSYRFNLSSNLVPQGSALSGTWNTAI